MASNYRYLDNAFWEDGTEDRSAVKCIRQETTEDGKRVNKEFLFRKINREGNECPGYKEVVGQLGVERIDNETKMRREKKEKSRHEARIKTEQMQKTKELEQLFALKLRALEIPEIRDSENKKLRTKIRRAQNEVEMNALSALLIGIELGYLKDERAD